MIKEKNPLLNFLTVYRKDLSIVDAYDFFFSTPLVVSIGVFDGVHKGHQKIIRRLIDESSASHPTVLSFSRNPKFNNGTGLDLITKEEKYTRLFSLGVEYIAELEFCDSVKNMSGAEFINLLFSFDNVKKLVVGSDFKCGVKGNSLDAWGIQKLYPNRIVIVDNYTIDGQKLSSSKIRGIIEKNGGLSKLEREEFF